MEELKTQFRQEDYLLQFASSQETEHFCQLAKGAAINWTREKHQLIIPENQTFQQGQKCCNSWLKMNWSPYSSKK